MQQLNLQGKTKEDEAIEFLQQHEPPEGYALFYSGGKDSEVIKKLAFLAGVKFDSYYSLMPDPPEVIQHLRKHHPDVKILHPKISFYWGVEHWFPPHFNARWCCYHIKERPSIRLPYTYRILGIRAEESPGRAKQGWINPRTKKRVNFHPIFDWNQYDVWDFIDRHKIPYCSLYDEGFSRLGCVVCPLRSAKETQLYKKRFPAQYRLFEKKCRNWWDRIGHYRQRIRGRAVLFSEFMEDWYRGR